MRSRLTILWSGATWDRGHGVGDYGIRDPIDYHGLSARRRARRFSARDVSGGWCEQYDRDESTSAASVPVRGCDDVFPPSPAEQLEITLDDVKSKN